MGIPWEAWSLIAAGVVFFATALGFVWRASHTITKIEENHDARIKANALAIANNKRQIDSRPCVADPDYGHDKGQQDALVKLGTEILQKVTDRLSDLERQSATFKEQLDNLEKLVDRMNNKEGK